MTILVQREHRVALGDRERFEAQERSGRWPALLHLGAQMVGYGAWEFGGPGDVVVTNTCYESFEHWLATRAEGPLRGQLPAEMQALIARSEGGETPVASSWARVLELDASASRPQPRYPRDGESPSLEPPPSLGRGSVISERTLALEPGKRDEFTRISAEQVWPWLEQQGGRLIGIGHDLMGASDEVTTWFAFTSAVEWHRFARPGTANAPGAVVQAFQARAALVRSQRGRLLTVQTDWGAA